ncbi:MAG: UDP-3-O-(3-hydroxymyristoyl)glucosamine N-acyltransferase [Puniceicoccales bacterium]|jgi:UDP-3-O-[3-hydroxymyristoyl] glucosamine N-acyltransferase|nr:UDP-3-O-(3-hydroxymyristoyl)glucosamine N-acyltransferase [Puniceicoccales bacterium]
MQFHLTLEEIRTIVHPVEIAGDFSGSIIQIASLQEAQPLTLSFLSNPKYSRDVATSKASLLLLPKDFKFSPASNQSAFFCEDPSMALAKICQHIEKLNKNRVLHTIHPSAVLHTSVNLGSHVSIGPCVVIEEGVKIGDHTRIDAGTFIGRHTSIGCDVEIFPNVSIMSFSQIGNRVVLHSGVVIGSDGFGFMKTEEGYEKIPQIGNVILEDDVDIGAHTTIDRARFASTIIGQGTKIDNLVQIGHNVKIGKNCIIISQAGIAGSVTLGDNVTLGGQVGIAGHLHIAEGTQIGAQSGVTKDTKPHSVLLGSPAAPYRETVQQLACIAKLPKILKKIGEISASDFATDF